MLINKSTGSYFLLAFVLFKAKCEQPQPENGDLLTIQNDISLNCGDCSLCVDACPTGAILPGALIDSNRCISYHTIESKEKEIMLHSKKHAWIFGCDICQSVCPFNKNRVFTLDNDFAARASTIAVANGMPQVNLNGSPLKRAGVKGLERNIRYVNDF